MDSDQGKLFIGGISWETDEEKLKEYFQGYGEVLQAVVMRDKITGKPRGFGFVVFADPDVLDRVLQDRHVIDGRTVEAKRALSREEQQVSKVGNSGGARNFGGGGAYGMVTDVVIMYDQQTNRPRGFGFISFDSEDAVDRVLHKTFHDLNGKQVEVKRALPKDANSGGGGRSMGGGAGVAVEDIRAMGLLLVIQAHMMVEWKPTGTRSHKVLVVDIHLMAHLDIMCLVTGMVLLVMAWVMDMEIMVFLLVEVMEILMLLMPRMVVFQMLKEIHGVHRLPLDMAMETLSGVLLVVAVVVGPLLVNLQLALLGMEIKVTVMVGMVVMKLLMVLLVGVREVAQMVALLLEIQAGSGGYGAGGYGDGSGNSGYGNSGWRSDPSQASGNYGGGYGGAST
ncbi:hypothetical protein DH2020_027497 [Rehmannia glutinosa]|uniref:RRM domain-containing protein n=1 Tax=Rehmannia glutinosa TaxID=99300 RepID=A0ABR0VY35_REHGL